MSDFEAILKKKKHAQAQAKAKYLIKITSPEYKARQLEKQREKLQKHKEKRLDHGMMKPKRKSHLKGRTPTAQEKRYMDAIGQLPCVCCLLDGNHQPTISLHHIKGRVCEHAHCYVLPLCQWHHDVPLSKELRQRYPTLIPIHAKGNFGGKGQFKAIYGDEWQLLDKVYEMLELPKFFNLN